MSLDNQATEAAHDRVSIERIDRIVRVTINRPAAFNALDLPTARRLLDALIEIDDDPSVSVVILTGAGSAFCGGGDVKAMHASSAAGGASRFLRRLTVFAHAITTTIARSPKIFIAQVNGVATGFGMSMVVACDLAYAAQDAYLQSGYTAIGLVPDGGATHTLTRVMGPKRALEFFAFNTPMSSEDAEEAGVINGVLETPALPRAVLDVATALASGPTTAFAETKTLVRAGIEADLEVHLETERRKIAACGATEHFQEGVNAFTDKRVPNFV